MANQSTVIAVAMVAHMAASSGVTTLKWLCRPRRTWATMTTYSITRVIAMTVADHLASRLLGR
ncbi:hypothetical protein GCM10023321_40950 [Pseudonocardia eucalypti]|uniref:Secreted protein n=1 Tax=Pseudonocardia eucalypti TaxID=648755 RepID=A0ABP9QCH0_9PSEU